MPMKSFFLQRGAMFNGVVPWSLKVAQPPALYVVDPSPSMIGIQIDSYSDNGTYAWYRKDFDTVGLYWFSPTSTGPGVIAVNTESQPTYPDSPLYNPPTPDLSAKSLSFDLSGGAQLRIAVNGGIVTSVNGVLVPRDASPSTRWAASNPTFRSAIAALVGKNATQVAQAMSSTILPAWAAAKVDTSMTVPGDATGIAGFGVAGWKEVKS
jgi:hypothetical protein